MSNANPPHFKDIKNSDGVVICRAVIEPPIEETPVADLQPRLTAIGKLRQEALAKEKQVLASIKSYAADVVVATLNEYTKESGIPNDAEIIIKTIDGIGRIKITGTWENI